VGDVHLYLVLDSWAVLSCSRCCKGSRLSNVLEILYSYKTKKNGRKLFQIENLKLHSGNPRCK
jgi:hypothetical protein